MLSKVWLLDRACFLARIHVLVYPSIVFSFVDELDTIESPDDQHLFARNMYRIGINKHKEKYCASSLLFTNINILVLARCFGF